MSIISTVPKGAAVEGINPNLLRNWYFVGGGTGRGVFPVNSRGQTVYPVSSTGASCIDGWKYQNKNNSLDLTQNGLAWESSVASGAIWLQQNFSLSSNSFLNKYLTFSVLLSSGELSIVTLGPVVLDTNIDSYITISGASNFFVRAYFSSSGSCSVTLRRDNGIFDVIIQAVKLELGDQQTLAHQENGVWVLNEIPDYEEELIKCKTSTTDSTDTYANKTLATEQEIAYVENGTTASRAYAIGEYFCWHGLLYRAKTAISSGSAFTVNTNCEQVTGGGLNYISNGLRMKAYTGLSFVFSNTNWATMAVSEVGSELAFAKAIIAFCTNQGSVLLAGLNGSKTTLQVFSAGGNLTATLTVNLIAFF